MSFLKPRLGQIPVITAIFVPAREVRKKGPKGLEGTVLLHHVYLAGIKKSMPRILKGLVNGTYAKEMFHHILKPLEAFSLP